MSITSDALSGKIILVPLNGLPVAVSKIPVNFVPHYSGAVVILTITDTGDTNLNIKQEFSLNIKGDAVVLSQDTWHGVISA